MLNTPFSPWPCFSEEEGNAVKEVLLSNKVNYWTGQECRLFETEFAQWAGVEHAIALANGTVALDMALKALQVGEGDEVIVTPRTFLASVSSVVNVGATPVFADVDLHTQNISADTIAAVITDKTKAIVVVHLAGLPADMDPIMRLANSRGVKVIEDCAQAHGARYKGRPVGSIGHIGAWSFCQDKIMTTAGEGGMVTTNDESLWRFMWSYKDHGKSYAAVYETEHPPGFRWLHHQFGTNWRMTEIQAAVGRIQLKKMPEWHDRRTQTAERFRAIVERYCFLRLDNVPEHSEHAWYKFYFFVNSELLPLEYSRDSIIARIIDAGVPCYQGSCSEVYLEKAFDNTDFRPAERLINAQRLGESSVMLLVHPSLTDKEVELTCEVLERIFDEIAKQR